MSQWVSPSFDDLERVIKASHGKLILCSPYIKGNALDKVSQSLPRAVTKIEVWTKLSGEDWLNKASDPPALAKFKEEVQAKGFSVSIFCLNNLHAKAIISDSSMALAGSANLTLGGFKGNKEVARIVSGSEVSDLRKVVNEIRGYVKSVSDESFRDFASWCERNKRLREERDKWLDKKLKDRQPPPLLPPPTDEGWIPLSEFKYSKEMKDRPPKLRLPDGCEVRCQYWWHIPMQIAEWLIRAGKLTAEKCPVKTQRGKLMIDTTTNEMKEYWHYPHELSNGFFLLKNGNTEEVIRRSKFLMDEFQQPRSSVCLKVN